MPEPEASDRIANFRDFGGGETRSGEMVARGRLFRAAHLANASDADLRRLADLGIRLVVDLRRPLERTAEPNRILAGSGARVISNDAGADIEAPHLAFLRRGDTSDAAVERYLLEYYGNAADEPRHRTLFADALEALQSLEGGMLVHCAAGKDRTGLLVALIQFVLGVPEAAIAAEYLRTNAVMVTPARVAAMRVRLEATMGHAPGDAAVHALLGVNARHLRHAFRSIAARHGSVEQYLDGLGIGAAARARIRERFLQPPMTQPQMT